MFAKVCSSHSIDSNDSIQSFDNYKQLFADIILLPIQLHSRVYCGTREANVKTMCSFFVFTSI